MSIFDRFSRGGREQAAREHAASGTLAAIERINDPKMADLQTLGITAEKLQDVVNLCELTPDQQARLLEIANRPEIREKLTPIVYPELKPVDPLPDRKTLEKELEPLNEREMQDALKAFGQDLKSGRLPIFAMGHVDGKQSVRMSRDNLFLLPEHLRQRVKDSPEGAEFQKLGRSRGEYSVWLDKLAPGYNQARKHFGQPAYDLLMQKPGWSFSEGKYVHQSTLGVNKRFEEDRRTVQSRAERRRFRTAVIDIYLPRQKMYEEALPNARAEIDERGRKLVRAVNHSVEAVKAVEVLINDGTEVIGDPRGSYLSVFILLGPSNKLQSALGRGGDMGNYRTYLRALRTNPGFFLEALRKHVPEVFESGTGRKYYGEEGESWEPDPMTMHLDVPELQAVGEPDKRTFRKMG